MTNYREQIVCISTHYWDDAWFRKQHFMSRFVKNGYEVAYIEPSFSLAKKPDNDKKKYQTNRKFKVSVERKNDNLFIIKPPRGLPYWSKPLVSRLNYMYFALRLRWILRKLGFRNYILWNYRPEYAPGINIFDYDKLVFDLTDDLAAYRGQDSKKYDYINQCTENIIKKSNLLIVTASALFEKYKGIAKKIDLIPNGFDSYLFSADIAEIPSDIKNIKSPIVGFIGTLFSFLDYALLEYIIKNNPDKSFAFIGNCEENARKDWEYITTFKNVHWLGRKKKEDIPAYIKNFDICINPFKVDEVSRSVSPLKVFEYLAMKKPVISVRMESLEKEEVAPFIYFASSYQDFNNKLNTALKEKDEFENKLNYQLVLKYSWDNLFEKVVTSLSNLYE